MNLPPISPLISAQFPSLYAEEGPAFIAFVKAYYEWMEQEGEVVSESRNLLSYRDVDRTLDKFLVHFRRKYLDGLPVVTELVDERFLLKHIREVYSSKGSPRGLELLFRVLFNQKAELYLPGDDILRLNDGTWIVPKYIEVSYSPDNYLLIGEYITGRDTSATALVENIKSFYKNGRKVDLLELGQVVGDFADGEQVFSSALEPSRSPVVFGSLRDIENFSIVFGFKVGDLLDVSGENGFSGKAVVTKVSPRDGTLSFRILNGGTGYSLEFTELRLEQTAGSSGTGAAVRVKSISGAVTKDVVLNRVFTQLAPDKFLDAIDDFYVNYSTPEFGIYSITVPDLSAYPFLGQVSILSSNTEIGTAKIVFKKDGALYTSATLTRQGTVELDAPVLNGSVYEYVANGTGTTLTEQVSVGDWLYLGDSTDAVQVIDVASDTSMTIEFSTAALTTGTPLTIKKVLDPLGGSVSISENSNVISGTSTKFTTTFRPGDIIVLMGSIPYQFTVEAVNSDTELEATTSSPVDLTSVPFRAVESKAVLSIGEISNSSINAVTLASSSLRYNGLDQQILSVAEAIDASDFLPIELLRHKTFGSTVEDPNSPWITSVISGWESFYANGNVVNYTLADEFSSRVKVTSPGNPDVFARIVRVNKSLDLSDYQDSTGAPTANSSMVLLSLDEFKDSSGQPISAEATIAVGATVEKVNSNNAVIPLTSLVIQDTATASDDSIASLLDIRSIDFGTISELEVISQGAGYTGAVEVTAIDPVSYGDQEIVLLPSYDPVTGEAGPLQETVSGTNAVIWARAGSGLGAIDEVKVLDSGYLFRTGDPVTLTSPKGVVSASAVADKNGIGVGKFINNAGFLSSEKYIQDNFYYQEYSYEIRAGLAVSSYADIVRKIWHPAGTILFGAGLYYDYLNEDLARTFDELYIIEFALEDGQVVMVGDVLQDIASSSLVSVETVDGSTMTVRLLNGISLSGTKLTNAVTGAVVAEVLSVSESGRAYNFIKETIDDEPESSPS